MSASRADKIAKKHSVAVASLTKHFEIIVSSFINVMSQVREGLAPYTPGNAEDLLKKWQLLKSDSNPFEGGFFSPAVKFLLQLFFFLESSYAFATQ